jgi:hypothetical protein
MERGVELDEECVRSGMRREMWDGTGSGMRRGMRSGTRKGIRNGIRSRMKMKEIHTCPFLPALFWNDVPVYNFYSVCLPGHFAQSVCLTFFLHCLPILLRFGLPKPAVFISITCQTCLIHRPSLFIISPQTC